jgi:hypothetical protein
VLDWLRLPIGGSDTPPFWILAKGKTNRCQAQFGIHPDVTSHPTQSGWTNEGMMIEYVEWL